MFKLLKKIAPRDWVLVFAAFCLILLQVWLNLTLPDFMSEITTLVQTPDSAMSDIWIAGGKMLLCALGSLVAAVLISICAARISSNFSASIRSKLFNRVQSFSMEEIGNFSTSSLITRSTNDITQVQMLIVLGLEVLMKAPVTAVWALLKISGKNWTWTAATGTAVIILLLVVAVCAIIAMPKFRKLQVLTDNLNRVTRENLSGLNVVRAYNAADYQEEKFEKANNELKDTQLFANRTMAVMMPSINLIMSGLTLSIYWLGAVMIDSAGLADKLPLFSDMIVFSQYAMQVVMAFMMLVMVFIMLPRASVAAKRINEVLEVIPTIHDGSVTESPAGISGEIEFKNVHFRYPEADTDVVEDLSFTIHKGETAAFIGSTGCGKSTVINLIPRFYDVTEGEILVDGINVKDYKQEALRDKIGYVSQKAVLFSGDISENILLGELNGRDDSIEAVKDAVSIAQAAEFVETQENTYHGYVSQGGSNFSGGQKQRLSIARAVFRHPEILIFDDSFSALDYKTDKTLRAALDEHCSDSTRLIVAQRIGTIRDADKIIVLDDGRIVGMGTHSELMKNCEVYQQIAYSQLSKEELA